METKSKTRKIIKSGDALIITLPKEFVVKSGLKKGDTVGITYDSFLVIINPKLPDEKEEKDALDNKLAGCIGEILQLIT